MDEKSIKTELERNGVNPSLSKNVVSLAKAGQKNKEKINYKAGALAICKLAGEKVRAEHSNKMRRVKDNKNG